MGGIYLYGIVETASGVNLGLAGLDGNSPVRIMTREGLGCVVSDYSGGAFTALSKEQIIRRLLAHQWVVERVMGERTVLPVKFGTLLNTTQEALDLLSQCHARLADALVAIRDKVEIEVAATWDTNRLLQEIGSEREVVRAKEAATRTGRLDREDMVRVGQMVKACMDKRRKAYQERMLSLLEPLCVDMASNVLVSDDLVMNVAFLVDRSQQAGFDAGVQLLDKLFKDDINFRVVGPLPTYTFSTVEVTRLKPELVDEARRTLHLGDVISEAEVRMAYRRMAAAEQRNLESGSSPDDLVTKLKHASDVLLRCLRAQREASGSERPDTPDGPSDRCLFDVAIRKSRSADVEPARFGGAARV